MYTWKCAGMRPPIASTYNVSNNSTFRKVFHPRITGTASQPPQPLLFYSHPYTDPFSSLLQHSSHCLVRPSPTQLQRRGNLVPVQTQFPLRAPTNPRKFPSSGMPLQICVWVRKLHLTFTPAFFFCGVLASPFLNCFLPSRLQITLASVRPTFMLDILIYFLFLMTHSI
jgi:hypothetical protein